jgi:hypothetical protein
VTGVPEEDDWEAATITIDWEAPTAVEQVPSALALMAELDKLVVGHSQAKEALVASLRIHITRESEVPPRVLLLGPRGVGKTSLAHALCHLTDLPSVRIDFGELALSGEVDLRRILAPLAGTDSSYGVLFLDTLEHLARPPKTSAPCFDPIAVQEELARTIAERERLVICGAVTTEEPLRHTAPQQELRTILASAAPLIPALAASFDLLIPVERLSAAQIARSFALSGSPFARARRVISSLGGTFHCDPSSVEALARTCAVSPVGGWAANRVIDRLLEQVLRSDDPAKPWRLRDPQT